MEPLLIVHTVLASILCGAIVGSRRGAAGTGCMLGFFFGPLGVLAAFAVDGRPQCGRCATHVDRRASVCPACGKDLTE